MSSEHQRTVLQGKRAEAIGIRIAILLVLGIGVLLVAKSGIGAMYAKTNTAGGLRRAIQWDSRNPQYYFRLSQLLSTSLDVPETKQLVVLDSAAVRLAPNRVAGWLELANHAEWDGDNRLAAKAYARALNLDPDSPGVNWASGNFDMRSGNTTKALRMLRVTISGDPALRAAAFDLAWHGTQDEKTILRESVTADHDVLFDYLNYLSTTNRLDDAAGVWRRIIQSHISFVPADAFGYLDTLLVSKRADELSAAWNAMLAAHLDGMPRPSSAGNLITNGDFETDTLRGGLDWRIEPVDGAEVIVNAMDCFDREDCLEIQFDGQHNLDYRGIYEFVPVRPDTLYRFTAFVKTEGITSDSGIRFWLLDYYHQAAPRLLTGDAIGTTNWTPETADVRTGVDTRVLEIIVNRVPSTKFDNKLSGRCWISHVSLVAQK